MALHSVKANPECQARALVIFLQTAMLEVVSFSIYQVPHVDERQMMHLRTLYGWQSPRVLPSRRYRSPKVPIMSFHCSSGCAVRQPEGHSYYTRAYSSCQISDTVQVGNCLQRICRSKAAGWTVQCYRRSFSSKRFMGPSYAAPITFIYLLYLHNIPPCNVWAQ